MQFLTPAAANNYLYSTQSNGLEVWAVVRQPDTGDVSHNTDEVVSLLDIGHLANLGYGLGYAASRVRGYTSGDRAGSDLKWFPQKARRKENTQYADFDGCC